MRDIIAGVDCGLYVESLIGVRMGNPIGGEFGNSVYVGYHIEGGELVGRLKNVMVAGNVYEAAARLGGIGSRPIWVDDDAYLPPVRGGSLREQGNLRSSPRQPRQRHRTGTEVRLKLGTRGGAFRWRLFGELTPLSIAIRETVNEKQGYDARSLRTLLASSRK